MGILDLFRIGKGTFKPALRAELEAEGIVLIEEGLRATISYRHFKAPGRRHHGKITAERVALAVSRRRLAIFCRSGAAKLVNTSFDEPRLGMLQVSLESPDKLALEVDYDRLGMPKHAGQITIRITTPNAPAIVEAIQQRLPRS